MIRKVLALESVIPLSYLPSNLSVFLMLPFVPAVLPQDKQLKQEIIPRPEEVPRTRRASIYLERRPDSVSGSASHLYNLISNKGMSHESYFPCTERVRI